MIKCKKIWKFIYKKKTVMYNYYTETTIKGNKKWKVEKQMKRTKQNGITLIALVITILFSYDEKLKFSNSKGFLLQTI